MISNAKSITCDESHQKIIENGTMDIDWKDIRKVADSGVYKGTIGENVKSVLRDFGKKHILVGFNVT